MKTRLNKTHYTNQVSNPYCSKGNFLWKHNDDSTLGDGPKRITLKELKERLDRDDVETNRNAWRVGIE